MKMTVQEIEQVSRSVASEYEADLSIVGVTAADGEADHAELLFELRACDDEPCMVQINVPRADREAMEQALRNGFESAIAEQRALASKM